MSPRKNYWRPINGSSGGYRKVSLTPRPPSKSPALAFTSTMLLLQPLALPAALLRPLPSLLQHLQHQLYQPLPPPRPLVGTSSPATAVGASSATNTPDSSSISHGLSTGAKAGIAIAAIFGVVFAVGAGWFLARKTGEKHGDNTGRAPPPSPLDRKEMKSSDSLQQQYMPTSVSTPQPAELEPDFSRSASTHELPGY